MRLDCKVVITEQYPWLIPLVDTPGYIKDGLFTLSALDSFSKVYLQSPAKEAYGGAYVVVIRVLNPLKVTEEDLSGAFNEINDCTRCLDLCFRYDYNSLAVVLSNQKQTSVLLERVVLRIKEILNEYALGHKIIVGQSSPDENITRTITRLAVEARF